MVIEFDGGSFAPNTEEENTQALADLLPLGVAWEAKNIQGSNINNLLTALAKEFKRVQEKIEEFVEEHKPDLTTLFLKKWEAAVGIPDDCFSNDESLEMRRKQIVAKLVKMNVQTVDDFIKLAKYFGYNVIIKNAAEGSSFPLTLPFTLGSFSFLINRVLVKFIDIDKPTNVFPLTLPFTLGGNRNIIICIFNKLKPVTVEIIYSICK